MLRPHHFQLHDIHFLMHGYNMAMEEGSTPQHQSYAIWRVPPHLRSRHLLKLITNPAASELTHQLVLADQSSITKKTLSKFESQDFIHIYQIDCYDSTHNTSTPGSQLTSLVWELPRYGLEFEQTGGGPLMSRDYSGYFLSPCQQLVGLPTQHQTVTSDTEPDCGHTCYTLPGFHQYLVLERGSDKSTHTTSGARIADKLILVPEGLVQSAALNGLVNIQVPTKSSDKIKVNDRIIKVVRTSLMCLGPHLHSPCYNLISPSPPSDHCCRLNVSSCCPSHANRFHKAML